MNANVLTLQNACLAVCTSLRHPPHAPATKLTFSYSSYSCLVPPWPSDGDASRCASRHVLWLHRLFLGLRAHVQPPPLARHPSRSRLPSTCIRHLLRDRIRHFCCHHQHHHVTRYQFHQERIAEPGAAASLQAPRKTWWVRRWWARTLPALRVVPVAAMMTRRHWQFCRRESCLAFVRRLRYSPS